jgi:hypothetical protein
MFPPEWAAVLGVLVALVGNLAARSDHRPARHRVALAPSRLLGNLGIRLMSPLAPRTPQDQWRGPRAYSPNEPREFLMGRAADPWRAAETWIRCLASHCVPLHAATGLSAHPEVAHLPAEPSICDRSDRFRRSRLDHASWPVRHQGAGWHPSRAYRAIVDLAPVVAISLFQSCRSARRPKALRARLLRGPPLKAAPIGLGRSTTFTASLKGITEKQPSIRELHTIIRYRTQSQTDHNSFAAIALCVCHEQSETLQKFAPGGALWRFATGALTDSHIRRSPRSFACQ